MRLGDSYRIALLLVCAALSVRGARAARAPHADEWIAPIETWVWHFDPMLAADCAPAYEDLLEAIPDDARIVVALRASAEAADFRARLRLATKVDPRVSLLFTGKPLTCWARDRYVFVPEAGRRRALLPVPTSVPPGWRGDLAVPGRLPACDPPLHLVETDLAMEGGNVLMTAGRVLVGEGLVLDNLHRFDRSRRAVVLELERVFERRIVVVGSPWVPVPHEHIDMYLSVVGPDKVLLGDPRLTLRMFGDHGRLRTAEGAAGDFVASRTTQLEYAAVYDKVDAYLRQEGFEIARIPILHGDDHESLLTWNNVVTERRGRVLRAYMPVYGIPALDEEARKTWERQGFRVFPIWAAGVIHSGGAVRCLTNVLRRVPARRAG